jgi:hypothetical protein
MASPEAWEAASVGSKVLYCNSPLVLGSQQLAMLNHWKSMGDPYVNPILCDKIVEHHGASWSIMEHHNFPWEIIPRA